MDELQQRIHETTFSLDAAHRRVGVWQQVLEHVVFQDDPAVSREERFATLLTETASPADQAAIKAWGTDWMANISSGSFANDLAAIRDWLTAVPTLDLYLPVAIDDHELAPLAQWCRTELSPQLLLDVTVDPQVVGGCGFVASGVYHDYSLHERLLRQPEAVTAIIEHYVTT